MKSFMHAAFISIFALMQITPDNLVKFLRTLEKRLAQEMEDGAVIEANFNSHYPDPPMVEIDGQVFPYPAIGETVSIQIGACPEPKF